MDAPFTPFEPHGKHESAGRIGKIELRFVLPNLITVLAICAGLSGIRLAFEGRFETAVLMVLLAAFLDGIDGRLARMMKGQSKFGAQMDSIADAVNFGAAPALVLYAYVFDQARSLGWIAALVYAIACCLRLAQFNVMNDNPEQSANAGDYFVGVPAPAGACLVMLPVYLGFLGLEATRTDSNVCRVVYCVDRPVDDQPAARLLRQARHKPHPARHCAAIDPRHHHLCGDARIFHMGNARALGARLSSVTAARGKSLAERASR